MKRTKGNLIRSLMAGLNKAVHEYQLETSSKVGVARYNRRTFIQQSTKGAIGVGVALSLPAMLISCKQETRPPQGVEQDPVLDVAILGGGMAGLNCANHLLGSGLTFKVYEGSKRVGGRILTHYNDSMQLGIFPEFGGDFIDSDHEDMIKLAKEFNLDLVDQIAEQEANQWVKDIYFFDNRKISEKEIIREFKKIAPKIAKDRDALGENYDTPEASRMDKMSLSEYLDSLKCKEWMKELLDAAFVAEFGLDCSEQSAINMLDLIITDTSEGFKVFGTSDERYRIKGGNSQITNKLAEKIGEDNILKNYKVTEISEGDNGMYTIVFENGEKVEAKVIVCTIPFTILREIKLSLKGMTPEKRKCIDELGYGINTKLVLGYEGQPWRSKENNAMGYLFTKDMTNGWDASLNRTENNENGAYVAFFGGKFSQSLCDESSRNPMSPPEHVWRTMLPEKRVNGFVDDLDKIFIRSKKKFKGKHVFVNWIEYPFVKASYACYKTGQWTTIAGHEAKPVGNFYFAGEHCSNNFQGFMNGAAESGRETAIQLIEKYAKVPVN